MKELTPIQQAIEKLKEGISQELEVCETPEKYHPHDVSTARYIVEAVNKNIKILTNLLPKEQAAIEEAYIGGDNLMSFNISDKATEYFTNKYKSNE